MNEVIKDILNGMKQSKIEDVEGAMNYMDGYFSTVGWSLEKDEWNRMTKSEKEEVCKEMLSYI